MRITPEGRGDRYAVFMDHDEYRQFRAASPTEEHRLLVRLMGEAGLRVHSAPKVRFENIESIRGKWFLQIPNVTTDRGPEFRDVFLADGLYQDLKQYKEAEGIADSEPLFDYVKRTIQTRINRVSEAAVDATGNEDFGYVSSYDLRRYYARKLLFEDRMHLMVVLELGGWRNLDALEPYIAFPGRDTVFDEIDRYSEVDADGS